MSGIIYLVSLYRDKRCVIQVLERDCNSLWADDATGLRIRQHVEHKCGFNSYSRVLVFAVLRRFHEYERDRWGDGFAEGLGLWRLGVVSFLATNRQVGPRQCSMAPDRF